MAAPRAPHLDRRGCEGCGLPAGVRRHARAHVVPPVQHPRHEGTLLRRHLRRLRQRLAIRVAAAARVPEGKHAPGRCAHHPEPRVDDNAAEAATVGQWPDLLFDPVDDFGGERPRARASSPHDEPAIELRHLPLIPSVHNPRLGIPPIRNACLDAEPRRRLDALHPRVESHAHSAVAQRGQSSRPERRVEGGKHTRRRVQHKVGELAAVLDAGGASANHNQRQQLPPALFAQPRLGGALEQLADRPAEFLRILQLLEEEAVLDHPRDLGHCRPDTARKDGQVVCQLDLLSLSPGRT
eukprot:scaffold17676_cov108-Isochrysis_galbana.AAC.6